MSELFIGKPIHWLVWAVIVPVLYGLGVERLHVRSFNWYLLALGVLGFAAVLFIRFTSRAGEILTREPIADEEFQQTPIDE
jgi:hypothetical protein